MNIASSIVSSKLWIKGCENVTAVGSNKWTFFYCIEGLESKFWTLLFVNACENKIFIRSQIIGLKLCQVAVQMNRYASNVYNMILESISPVKNWVLPTDNTNGETYSSEHKNNMASLGILQSSNSQIYPCAPPIFFKDTYTPVILDKTQESPFIRQSKFIVSKIHNFTVYKGGIGNNHSSHFNKTSINSLEVDSRTFHVKFIISSQEPRKSGACLECSNSSQGVLNSTMSNLMVNH